MQNKFSHWFATLLLSIIALSLVGQGQMDGNTLHISTNLGKLENGKLRVTISAPAHARDTLIYEMPKIVPGTYAIGNYGVLVSDLTAIDADGKTTSALSLDENRWQIVNAKNIKTLSYLVAPSFTDPAGGHIFEPAGTRFIEGKNFVLNNFGVVGYFKDFENLTYQFEVIKPKGMYGSTALKCEVINDSTDVFSAAGYFNFHDSPIMYAEPDTAQIYIGNTLIEVAVYSPRKSMDAQFVMSEVKDIMKGAEMYLGGQLPVDKYVILITLLDGMSASGGYGALEHAYSTVFVLPEMPKEFLAQTIRDVTAHEFFHIVTPLNIHSEHIHNYNFSEPQMSQHLWFYEGCTEYAAHHMQVQQGLISPNDFLEVVASKVQQASAYNDVLPFTEMSKGALDVHANQYGNVYLKGALIGMCLDLLLCESSDGEYNLPKLMADLSQKFGPDRPFEDEELFSEIAALGGPEVMNFFNRYVAGNEPLPLKEYLDWAGVDFAHNVMVKEISFGGFLPGYNEQLNLVNVASTVGMNSFGRSLGLQKGDSFISVNGISLSPENFATGIKEFKNQTTEGSVVKLAIVRKDKKGRWKRKTLTSKAEIVERKVNLDITYNANPTVKQLRIRKAWINN
jgi:predicted metalloprotease with PDZ domain